jgi:hypothetical protein
MITEIAPDSLRLAVKIFTTAARRRNGKIKLAIAI